MTDTLDRIFSEAHVLVSRDGTDFSFRELQRSAGIGSGTLRRRVKNKTALIEAYADDLLANARSFFEAWAMENPAELHLEKWCFLLLESVLLMRGLADTIIGCMLSESSELHAVAVAVAVVAATEPVAAAAMDRGRLRNDADATDVVLAVLAAVAMSDRRHDGPASLTAERRRRTAERMLTIALCGLGTIEVDHPLPARQETSDTREAGPDEIGADPVKR